MKKLIIGKLNNKYDLFFWDLNGNNCNIGDYAVVENCNGYDLVKIEGKAVVSDEFHYGHKIVKVILKKDDVEKDIIPF